jgi:alpha/beta hydrolase fold
MSGGKVLPILLEERPGIVGGAGSAPRLSLVPHPPRRLVLASRSTARRQPAVPPRPPRPPAWEERLSYRLFFLLSPPRNGPPAAATPAELAPFEEVVLPRRRGPGALAATWYPALGPARGAVLLLHPWMGWGRAYFHRRGRIEALRAAGYHALAADLPGFGGSGPPAGFFDLDAEDALAALRALAPGLPLHVWGISSGGYWLHPLLSRAEGVGGAMFEDVSPHLFEWGWRMVPWARPGFLFFRTVFRRSYRFLDMRRHGPAFHVRAAAYASGATDLGVRPEDTRALAAAAGAEALIVPGAGHLQAIKVAGAEVIALALATFARAESPHSAGRSEV